MNLSDDEYRDHVSRLRSAINAAPPSAYSHVAHAGKVGGYSPERHAAHEAILDDAWSELGGDSIPKGRQGLILGGTPGSGKTSVRESAKVPGVGPVKGGFLPIDSDYFKGKLIDAGLAPSLRGFSPMEAAPLMHKESNDIAKKFAQRAYDQGTNLAWDYTLRHSTSGPNRLKEFGRYDYTPHGIYVHATPDDALSRVANRHRDDLTQYMEGLHRHGGRYVPPEIITDSVHGNRIANRENYDAIAHRLASSQIFNTSARTAQARTVPDPNNPRALIVVDVQNDFVNGSLPVTGGTEAANKIGQVLRGEDPDLHHGAYNQVISTQDWHHDPGDHFSDTPDYVNTWPVHCQAGTPGSELHPALEGGRIDHQFQKGHYSAAYSGFEGQHAQNGSNLTDHLRNSGIGHVDVCGIATDHCVKATALDAAKNGFKTRVLLPYTAAVSDDGLHGALGELRNAGVEIVGNNVATPTAKQANRAWNRYLGWVNRLAAEPTGEHLREQRKGDPDWDRFYENAPAWKAPETDFGHFADQDSVDHYTTTHDTTQNKRPAVREPYDGEFEGEMPYLSDDRSHYLYRDHSLYEQPQYAMLRRHEMNPYQGLYASRTAMPQGRPSYLDDPNYVPTWTPKKPSYCQCGDRWLGGHGRMIIDKTERARHVPVKPGTRLHNKFEEDDFADRGGGWSTPENPRTCSCGDPYERDHAFMGPSHWPETTCKGCDEPWSYEHSFLNGKHGPGWNGTRRTSGLSDQPDDVTDDYSLAEFFQWCAHNRKDADQHSLAQYAAVSGMDTENYLDIYLFLSDDEGFTRHAVLAPDLKKLHNITDVMKHLGMDAKSIRGYIANGDFPTPTHQGNNRGGLLWDNMDNWEKWHTKYKKLREEIPLYGGTWGAAALPKGWAQEFKTGKEPKPMHTVKDLAKEFGVGDSTVLSWYKRKNITSKPPSPSHIGANGIHHFWESLDPMREWFQKYKNGVTPNDKGGIQESPGQGDLLQRELPPALGKGTVIDDGAQATAVGPVITTQLPSQIPPTKAQPRAIPTCPNCFTQHAGECL